MLKIQIQDLLYTVYIPLLTITHHKRTLIIVKASHYSRRKLLFGAELNFPAWRHI